MTPNFDATAPSNIKPSLVGLSRAQMAAALRAIDLPEREIKMRVGQLWHWIYFQGVSDFDRMTNVSKTMRNTLADHFSLSRPEVVTEQVSSDGTRKWLFRMPPVAQDHLAGKNMGAEIECVYIPESDRGTLCVSSQVGCTLTCTFCHTGTQKLVRNLTSQEIGGGARPARRLSRIKRARHGLCAVRRGRAGGVQHRVHGDGRAAL
jgi:23S rRNA (adenine2503-C2)-methyltransferase